MLPISCGRAEAKAGEFAYESYAEREANCLKVKEVKMLKRM